MIVLLLGVIMSIVAYDWGVQQGRIEERRVQQARRRYMQPQSWDKDPAQGIK